MCDIGEELFFTLGGAIAKGGLEVFEDPKCDKLECFAMVAGGAVGSWAGAETGKLTGGVLLAMRSCLQEPRENGV